jgi:hypothetical protein
VAECCLAQEDYYHQLGQVPRAEIALALEDYPAGKEQRLRRVEGSRRLLG